MKLKNTYIVVLILLCSACESNQITIDSDNLLLGNWVSPIYEGESTTFTRGSSLPEEGYGIAFKQTGEFTERSSGFCGTPPLSFFNVDGIFTLDNDLISISRENYPSSFGWKILELTNEKLVVKREYTDQEKDHQVLMELYSEISNLAYSKSCTDANDWSFVAFGAKACGGPQGYLPYNKNIDVASFLEKVEIYTEAEKEYNIKWGVVSNCSLVNPPKRIDCQYQYPVLIY